MNYPALAKSARAGHPRVLWWTHNACRRPGHAAPPPAQNFQLNNCCADAHSMPWAAAEAKPSKRIVCSLGNPDGAVLGKPRGGSSRRNTKAAVGYITAKMLHTEPKRPMSRFFMSGAPVWRVPIRVVVNALSPTRCKGQIFGRSGSLPLLRLCHTSISHSTHLAPVHRHGRSGFETSPHADDAI